MAKSTGIVLTAGIIATGNHYLQDQNIGAIFRPAAATLLAAAIFAGLEKLDEQAAVGLAVIAVIAVIFGPVAPSTAINPKTGKKYISPAQEILSLFPAPKAAA
jgi:hypothetical protein